MKISAATVDESFNAFHWRYVANPTRPWDLDHHAGLWADAQASVESGSDDSGFLRTLGQLRSHWQIARGKGSEMMKDENVLPVLRKEAGKVTAKRLTELVEKDAGRLASLVNAVADIKRVNGKPSLMAISKVLHFFNPHIFVIVDRAMIWDWTLNHDWLWEPIRVIRDRVDQVTGCDSKTRDDSACDVSSYVAILIGCGQLLRDNPHVCQQFGAFLRNHTTAKARLPKDLEMYEAAAVEWLLLGLVELPPAGITL